MIDVILNAKQIKELTGLSRTTIWRLEKGGSFPQRVQLSSSRVGWSRDEVGVWMNTRKAARDSRVDSTYHVGGAG